MNRKRDNPRNRVSSVLTRREATDHTGMLRMCEKGREGLGGKHVALTPTPANNNHSSDSHAMNKQHKETACTLHAWRRSRLSCWNGREQTDTGGCSPYIYAVLQVPVHIRYGGTS